jgi:hypothetical protein
MRAPVLAESLTVFNAYINEHKLNRSHFDYISNHTSIRGRRGVFLTVGRWWRNPNYRTEWFYEALKGSMNNGNCSLIDVKWESEERYELLRQM